MSINKNTNNKQASMFRELWISSMLDDFNTAQAIGYYFKYINEGILTISNLDLIEEFEETIGIDGWRDEINNSINLQKSSNRNFNEEQIQKIILERASARDAKDWEKADILRSEAKELGIRLIDNEDGTSWEEDD